MLLCNFDANLQVHGRPLRCWVPPFLASWDLLTGFQQKCWISQVQAQTTQKHVFVFSKPPPGGTYLTNKFPPTHMWEDEGQQYRAWNDFEANSNLNQRCSHCLCFNCWLCVSCVQFGCWVDLMQSNYLHQSCQITSIILQAPVLVWALSRWLLCSVWWLVDLRDTDSDIIYSNTRPAPQGVYWEISPWGQFFSMHSQGQISRTHPSAENNKMKIKQN